MSISPLNLIVLSLLAVPLATGAQQELRSLSSITHDHNARLGASKVPNVSGTLTDKVRKATERYKDINAAIADGWIQGSPCVSGPNEGAMGVHYVQPPRINDAVLDAAKPEALIYEPLPGGRVRLVGVEFIAIADVWNAAHTTPPALEGHLFNLVSTPNRYGLPAFYELHVWAWQSNPNGSFADWNTLVSCDFQPGG